MGFGVTLGQGHWALRLWMKPQASWLWILLVELRHVGGWAPWLVNLFGAQVGKFTF